MKATIRLKIDVSKIDKTALFKGAKGTYLDATLFLDDDEDQYGNNGMIVQDIGKQRRDAGERGAILGNAKIAKIEFNGSGQDRPARQPAQSRPPANQPPADDFDDNDDIPF